MSTATSGVELVIPNASIELSWLITNLSLPLVPRFSTDNLGVFGGDSCGDPTTDQVLPIKPLPTHQP